MNLFVDLGYIRKKFAELWKEWYFVERLRKFDNLAMAKRKQKLKIRKQKKREKIVRSLEKNTRNRGRTLSLSPERRLRQDQIKREPGAQVISKAQSIADLRMTEPLGRDLKREVFEWTQEYRASLERRDVAAEDSTGISTIVDNLDVYDSEHVIVQDDDVEEGEIQEVAEVEDKMEEGVENMPVVGWENEGDLSTLRDEGDEQEELSKGRGLLLNSSSKVLRRKMRLGAKPRGKGQRMMIPFL